MNPEDIVNVLCERNNFWLPGPCAPGGRMGEGTKEQMVFLPDLPICLFGSTRRSKAIVLVHLHLHCESS